MPVLEWLFEKPRRDYFDNVRTEQPDKKVRYETVSSVDKRTDVTIMNMRVGDYVTYRGIDYYLRQRYIYRAGSYEWMSYQLSDSSKQNSLWLDVEDDDEINIEITEPISIPEGVTVENLKAKRPFTYNGEVFVYDEHGYAQVKIEKEDKRWDSETVKYWDYYNKDETKFLSLELWGNDELEASTGYPIKDFELDIYPGS
ncbi:MAG: DUF4178 domain-containing protein [Cyanobacteriota bacterium]